MTLGIVMISNDSIEFVGYHGTDSNNVSQIYESNFRISEDSDEWLGDGTYFFVDGVSCPIKNAREWAKNEAYKSSNYKYYSILKVPVIGEKILDLTTTDGLKTFNILRTKLIEKYNHYFSKDRNFYEDDTFIFNKLHEQ